MSSEANHERTSDFVPGLAVFSATLLWGTWWIPLRSLAETGVGGSWANAVGMTLPMTVLLPFAFLNRARLCNSGWALWASGILIAAAIALYAEALLRGYVARVLLLFYLTTVWSTLLSRYLLSVPIDTQRMIGIALSLGGAFVIFGADGGAPLPRHMSDWMALISGFLWAFGTVFLHRVEKHPLSDKIVIPFVFIGPLFLLFALLPGGHELRIPTADTVIAAAPMLMAVAFCWTLPLTVLTLFGASRLDPGKVAILLTFEIVVGIVSAWLLAGEPFGLHEALGTLLILTAVSSEFFAGWIKK